MSAIDFDALAGSDELSLEDILAIEQAGSEKGIYQRDLLDFVHSNKVGVPYNFTNKNAQSVKMGFSSAVDAIQKRDDISAEDKDAVKQVEVRVRKGPKVEGEDQKEYVFLINQKVVAEKKGQAAPAPVGAEVE